MVIFKFKEWLHDDVFEKIKADLKAAFDPERILVIRGGEVDIIFYNEGKKRCSYCGRLGDGDTCESCGATLK